MLGMLYAGVCSRKPQRVVIEGCVHLDNDPRHGNAGEHAELRHSNAAMKGISGSCLVTNDTPQETPKGTRPKKEGHQEAGFGI